MGISGAVIRELRRRLPELPLLENEPMSVHTSFRIGGRAALVASPISPEQVCDTVGVLHELGVTPLVMGNGTNLLVTDEPLDAVFIRMGDGMAEMEYEGGGVIRAGAGVPLARLAQKAQSLGLTGLEFAHGIPGTLGGAVSMNAGAYGGEMRDVLISADFCDGSGERHRLEGDELGLSYRRSAFTGTDAIILGARVKLSEGDPEAISARMRELSEKRRASQPLDVPSAGSTFKRPVGGYAAALIDGAGLKGFAIGGAQVSEKHAGFVINRGGATFGDVVALMEHIQKTVLEKDGILLEPEVKIVR